MNSLATIYSMLNATPPSLPTMNSLATIYSMLNATPPSLPTMNSLETVYSIEILRNATSPFIYSRTRVAMINASVLYSPW